MAKKKQAKRRKSTSGGSLMNMRSGFKKMAGTGGKKGKGGKNEVSFFTVLGWLLAAALILVLIWRLRS